jgi:GNAT superfamily N-acetyltransferase
MDVVVREIEPQLAEDFLALFNSADAQSGVYRTGCYCYYHLFDGSRDEWGARTADQNRSAMDQHIAAGRASGFLAYVDGRPVGWCHASPKAAFPWVSGGPYGRGVDLNEIGAIVCFLIAPAYRRRGIARRLLNAACASLGERGFPYAEAYPLMSPGTDAQEYRGWLNMYLDAGFTVVTTGGDRRRGLTVATVRKWLDVPPEWEHSPLLPLRIKALYEVHQAYESIAGMARVRLASINRQRLPSQRYTRATLIREYTARAGEANDLAVRLGLITPEESAEFIRAFSKAHPEVWKDY